MLAVDEALVAEHVRLSGQLDGGDVSRVAALFDDVLGNHFGVSRSEAMCKYGAESSEVSVEAGSYD